MQAIVKLLMKAVSPEVKSQVKSAILRGKDLEVALNDLIHGGLTGPDSVAKLLTAKAALDALLSAIRNLEKTIGVA